ncbi:MAG: ATP-dependent RecD-like DNA helicase [Christensenellaceae bacterium]|jgi:exodeoxyribonuclease V alpha subunit|nr:ATP-dependent RecD-like DNA helicase [Christensenellaceae bacterium]
MTINGVISSILFRNVDTGYTVVAFSTDKGSLTAVGSFPEIKVGTLLTITGEYEENARFGTQFRAIDVMYSTPTGQEGIIEYLGSGLISGIGQSMARRIVEKFGLRTLEVLEKTPRKLLTISGIGAKTLQKITISFNAHKCMQNTIIFLRNHDVTMGQSIKIYKAYNEHSIKIVSENPYRLIEDIDGIGFLTADRIALKLGFSSDGNFRIMAAIIHVLREEMLNGHTYSPLPDLITKTKDALGIDEKSKITDCIEILCINSKIVKYKFENDNKDIETYAVALSSNYNTERSIARRLCDLVSGVDTIEINVEKAIKKYEYSNNIRLHSVQKLAITTAIKDGVMVITGGPGTGKTTIIKCVLEIFNDCGLKTLLAAPTGRAAKRLSETSGDNAKTIHRLLGAEFGSTGLVYVYNELNTLDANVLIVDEISMADIFILLALLRALAAGTRLILVGDKDQLPSVSAGNVLSDIINSKIMPVIRLTEIYRQDADSLIILNAHHINNGRMPELDNRSKDFFFDEKTAPSDILNTVVSLVSERLPRYMKIDPNDIQVLAPLKKGLTGVVNLNIELQKVLNPREKNDVEVKINDTYLKIGDKVMQIVNNYNLQWHKKITHESGSGVYNGDIGYIVNIDDDKIFVEFEDGRVGCYCKDDRYQLILAYAVTVHKSQGSEFPVVVIVISSGSYMLLNRNLLYTAVTRARNAVVIVGTRENLERMVKSNYIEKRYTLLKELICKTKQILA